MMESGERRRGESLQSENVGTVRVGDRLERNFTDWNGRIDRETAICNVHQGFFPFSQSRLIRTRTVSAATLGNLPSLG